ncbi:Gag-Pol protein [Plakobranchus ocellatus]|uniref:Gag-Pol protein n=1 Tax=Plakobranchus ocellatus TaxID=259542 RepID=A0AAV4D4A2_9GAST|nr:Gag-Pol protein [Plakobranchus ocellatus]
MITSSIVKSWRLIYINTGLASASIFIRLTVQVALFLHCLDDDALKACNSFSFLSPESDRSVSDIIAKFESFAIGEVNETYERFVFNSRAQKDTEIFEGFYSDLRRLVKTCNYCDKCLDSILRDRIVLGVRDNDIQHDLLKIRSLTLSKAIDVCKAAENTDRHRRTMNMSSQVSTAVNAVTKAKRAYRSSGATRPPTSLRSARCKYCGRQHEMLKSKCPAFGKECGKCHGRNHFASMCKTSRKANVNNLESSDSESEPAWVNTVHDRRAKLVRCKLIVKRTPVAFLIDSGASVNVLPKKLAKNLIPSITSLTSFGGSSLSCVGKTREILKNAKTKKKFNVEFVVCEQNVQPILGLRAAEQMGLLSLKSANLEEVFLLSSLECIPVFNDELGQFPGQQHLTTDPNVKPVIMPNRRVPIAVRGRFKQELDRLTELGVLAPVTEPTPWVSQIVVAHKKNGQLRICIDPKFFNKALLREHYTMPLLDDVLHELSESRVFTKVNLRNGFWHVLLDTESSLLTTFQTCYGRYRWLRLPFGLSVSSEIFQRKILELFGAFPGVVAIHDDVIIHGRNRQDHDLNLQRFLSACEKYGVRLNKNKLALASGKINFMGHVISSGGIRTDPEKVRAISDFPQPTSLTEVRRFLGMVQYLSRYISNLTEDLHPIQNLTKKDVPFLWSENQENAFLAIKAKFADSPCLATYNPSKELVLENKASEYGLGSVLLQDGKPLGFASRTLTDSERNYAQIEKELLAVIFGMKKFYHYTYARPVTVITDHKPLVSIANKPLSKAPKRLQSMFLNLQAFDYHLIYKPGAQLHVSDSLSRAPVSTSDDVYTCNNISDTPFNDSRLSEIKATTSLDPALSQLKLTILQGWPDLKSDLHSSVLPYFNYRDELTVQDGIILRGDRIVIPSSLRQDLK